MTTLATSLTRASSTYLERTYLPRFERALETLPPADLWWRPHEGVISIGTILLHLEGNVRQWIVCGLGGADDQRDRAAEFAASDGPASRELFERLAATVHEACAVIESLDERALLAQHSIQGERVTGVYALTHVVEHFGWHTGQAVWIAKARAGAEHGLSFYDDAKVDAAHNH